jgi:two-component system, cell cycle sensor histidine kinase and response regulator CckA
MGLVNNDESKQIRRLIGRARRYRQQLELLPVAVVVQSAGEIRYVNEAGAKLFGVDARQLIGRRYSDLVLAATPAGPRVEQQTLRRPDGKLLEVEAASHVFQRGKRRFAQTVLREYTSTREYRETPAERLRMVAEAKSAIVTLDPIGDVVQWSHTAEQMTGYGATETIGRSMLLLIPEDEAERYNFEDILRRTVKEGRTQIEGWKRRKDGSRFYAMQVFTVLLDRSGGVAGFSLSIRDLTEQTSGLSLLRETEEQLRQAQRMEAVGRLASGIAHDFNNLLTAIQGHAQFLTEDLDADHPSRADVDEILHSSERAAALTRQLLAFSRGQRLQPESIQLNSVVAAMERLLRRVISEDITVESVLEPQLWTVRADPSQVEQVLVNLIVNARDAMPRGGRITIKTANAELATSYAQRREEVEPGEYVMLAVSDTGVGMDAETQAHIFEPFFTTKGPEKGTGLGLSTVFGIVRQMNGHIYVYSEPSQGTTFKVYLPRAGGRVASSSAREQLRDRARSREAVLIVEDDDSVRALARRVLESRDYRVWLAATAEEAVQILHDYGAELSLLITDVVLPSKGGRDLAQQALRVYPHLAVVYMSGYTDEELRRHGLIGANDHFIEKPFTPEAFAHRVREAIDDVAVSLPRSQP